MFYVTIRWQIILFVLLGGCNTMTASAIDIDKADLAYREGRFTDAERYYREVSKRAPENAHALEQLGLIALWRNDLEPAENFLKRSQQKKSWLARRWPLSATINTRLALVHGRAGRYRESASFLRKAAGWLPVGPFRGLRIRARQLELFGEHAPYTIEGPNETTVAFVVTDPLPVVSLSVNGRKPANFSIDTGGEGIILDRDFASENGAVIVGQVAGEYAGGERGMTGYGMVEKIQLGDIVVRHVPVSTLDLQPIARTVFPGMEIKGIIGTGFLMRFLATIDYQKQQLVLRRLGMSAEDVNTALGISGQDAVFPMWLVETHLIFSEGSVNELPPGLMFIDTGLAGAGFLASRSIFDEAGVAMDWSKAGMGAGAGGMTKGLDVTVAEVRLGRGEQAIRKRDVRGIVFENDLNIFKGSLGFQVNGLISHQFFRDYSVSFDFSNMRLVLQR